MMTKRGFVSYAHADRQPKTTLLDLLEPNLKILDGVQLTLWQDVDLTMGMDWEHQIRDAVDASDYGLLLISPAFLASDFIARHELPAFIGEMATKGALPVGLKPVPLDKSRDTQGVDRYQIFTSRPAGKFFTETRGAERERFAVDLATAIRDRMLSDVR